MSLPREVQLIGCVGGIYLSYLAFGYYQEDIMSTRWGPTQERFNFTSFLLMTQSIINALCAGLVLLVVPLPRDKTPFLKYAQVSISSIAAMFCSNRALLYVDYPTQVLAKSCKSIPVMLMGVIVFRRKYSLVKYACVFMVAAGIALFMIPSGGHTHKASENQSNTSFFFGVGFLVASLALDGLTGPFQDSLIHTYKPSSPHVMFFSNVWASIVMFIVVLVSGDLLPAISFCVSYPEIVTPIAMFSICSALGQNFIYYTIHQFGSLTCTTVTTTRKFFTILASVLWFGHYVSARQWFAVALVFIGLGIDIAYGYLFRKPINKSK
eukprot:Phypoly_transcript_11073.p1 GENE.Phypoly_transcript_11073~~Phypoly_transcript_11073.p1  ORF type:complete len:323 (+),score=24.24 Phypoly_transcript_11073:114-1082(+)